jgi:hypothetical protein
MGLLIVPIVRPLTVVGRAVQADNSSMADQVLIIVMGAGVEVSCVPKLHKT